MTLETELRSGLDELGLQLADAQVRQLLDYQSLLAKWNKVYNLTSVRDPAQMLTHHLLDSLAVLPPLARQAPHAQSLLDVGSGGGLPGVVIAISRPDLRVDCVDTVAKKAAFIQQAAAQLELPNLRGLHARVETLSTPYDVVASRAFASLADFTVWSAASLAEQGIWMAMKGREPKDEIAALPPEVEVFHVEQLHVPGLDEQRCMVWMRHRR